MTVESGSQRLAAHHFSTLDIAPWTLDNQYVKRPGVAGLPLYSGRISS